jgi:cytochrome c551
MLRISALTMVASMMAAGCGGGGGQVRDPNEVAAQYQGDLQSSDVAQGETVFNNICMSCHGGGAPALDGLGWSPGQMRQQVREGGGRMPAINESRLSAADLEAMLAYLTTIDAVNATLPGGAPEAEPAAEGTGEEPTEPPAE